MNKKYRRVLVYISGGMSVRSSGVGEGTRIDAHRDENRDEYQHMNVDILSKFVCYKKI